VGIGLSVVKEYVDRMGAELHIDDAPGGGARFVVDFPSPTDRPTPSLTDERGSGVHDAIPS